MAKLSEIDICNHSLAHLGNKRIQNFAQETEEARRCSEFYASVRDEMLERDDWKFAMKRASLVQLADAPLFGFSYAYALPSDYLRILHTQYDSEFEVEDNKLLSFQPAVNVKYIRIVEDPTSFHQLFRLAFEAKLGAALSLPLTQKGTLKAALEDLAEGYRRDALERGAIETKRKEDDVPDNNWVTEGRTGIDTDPLIRL
jgi:hypothetical protein